MAPKKKPPFPGPSPTASGYEREQRALPETQYITARRGVAVSEDFYALSQVEMVEMLRQATAARRQYETPAVRNAQDETALGQMLPKREAGEPLLVWLQRCQIAAVTAALKLAAYTDPLLEITKIPGGWEVYHKGNGQRIEVAAQQEVGDGA